MNEPMQNRVGDNSPQATASANVGVGLFLAIAAFGIALVSLGMQIRNDVVIDAKVAAAIAPANEVARTAAQNAKLAEDRANKMAAMLEARGLIKLENH